MIMRILKKYSKYSQVILRFGIAMVFIYFGILAISQPALQAMTWIPLSINRLISLVLPIPVFMAVLGVFQICVGIAFLFNLFFKVTAITAIIFLIFVIVSIGFNDIAFRDFAILTGIISLLLARGQA